jgi:hypothetical protein
VAKSGRFSEIQQTKSYLLLTILRQITEIISLTGYILKNQFSHSEQLIRLQQFAKGKVDTRRRPDFIGTDTERKEKMLGRKYEEKMGKM